MTQTWRALMVRIAGHALEHATSSTGVIVGLRLSDRPAASGRGCTAFILSLVAVAFFNPAAAAGAARKPVTEEGEFSILVDGREIGTERFVIRADAASSSSTSVLEFRNPSESRQKVRLETRLDMDGSYVPRAYLLKSDVDGNRGTMSGQFAPNQAMFEYVSGGKPQKRGLLVGNKYTILDSNIYHHFIFLARLFDYGSAEKTQKFDVLVPQEMDSGALKVTQLNRENLEIRGKRREVRVLQVDSGAVQIRLLVDKDGLLEKISVPAKALEVIRR